MVGRVREAEGNVQTPHNHHQVKGAIPVPATLSIELGEMVHDAQNHVGYRFVSDHSFGGQPSHDLPPFETRVLATFRSGDASPASLTETTGDLLNDSPTLTTPVVMSNACVSCHNTHPDSPERNWKVGDVRGLQLICVTQTVAIA